MAREDELRAEETEAEQEAQVFAVTRGLAGWRFSRRDFLTAAGGAAVAAAAGANAGCQGPQPETVEPTEPSSHAVTGTRAATETPTPERTDTRRPTKTSTPTRTSTPTSTPEQPASTKTATPGAPRAQFIADVTVPDGTILNPGESFTKTWRVKNVGRIPWGGGTQLLFASGAEMQGRSPVSVGDVAAGNTIEVSVAMTAPTEPGDYTGRWNLNAGSGLLMLTLTVVISVAPGEPGEVPPGETGINVTGPSGETRTMPCGSAIPPGWTCTCHCVTVPQACSCVGHCSCDRVCTCDTVCTCEGHGHYWYPN